MRRNRLLLPALLALVLPLNPNAFAATDATILPPVLEPAGTGGYAALDRALGKLSTHRRLLVVGAHPDDEDTAALSYVSRALDGEAAYLSLSRGEGGQNLIGPDLGEGLGVIRTQELLAARAIDGGRQYFTRAFDFGYTRSLDETLGKWPEEALLEDAVRVIRRFKPQVILSVFGDDGSGGHGQHQAAGHTAFLAYARSADPAILGSEPAPPWKASSLFRAGWFDPDNAKVVLAMGDIDPWSGYSAPQIAARSRSQHRSQDMGRLLELGSRDARYRFVEGAGSAEGGDLFAGIDTSLAGIAVPLGDSAAASSIRVHLAAAESAVRTARESLRPDRLELAVEPLRRALGDLDSARASCGAPSGPSTAAWRAAAELIEEKIHIGEQALLVAAGVALDAAVDVPELVPGGDATITWSIWNSGSHPLRIRALGTIGLPGLEVASADDFAARLQAAGELAPGALVRLERQLRVPVTAQVTHPYFLVRERQGDLYDWSVAPAETRGEPFGMPAVEARFELELAGRRIVIEREAVYRRADQAEGEIRTPLRVVPRLELAVDPPVVVWPRGARAPRVHVTLRSHGGAYSGEIAFGGDCRRMSSPATPFRIADPGGSTTVEVAVPECVGGSESSAGRRRVELLATASDGERAVPGAPLAEASHIPSTPMRGAGSFDLVVADIALPALESVGYVRGASDRVPDLLAEIGLPIRVLDAEALRNADLAGFDAIVIGSRAYETDAALQGANARLLDYARGGGLVIVQYQQYPFIEGSYAPFPMTIARPHDRITDENAPVRMLSPDHPALVSPNRISAADWDGWVQERALYMPSTWDPAFEPLLEMQDPGEPARRGALLVAALGKGTWVYTGISFFRELPAGVAGVYRLFANLLALGSTAPERAASLAARGQALADRALVVDTHIDVPYRLKEEMEDVSVRTAKGDFDYPRAVAGGLDVTFMSIYIPASLQETGGAKALADELIDMVEGIAAAAPDKWAMAASPDAALANRAAGRRSFALGIENGAAIEDDLANVRHFFDRGVRYVTLTHSKNNLIGDSSYEKADGRLWHGLSPFGREVVAEMNRLGILIDLSHVSDETFDQALALSQAPPIASHSSARHFTPGFERNVDDERIRALAAKGGVIQINFGSSFLTAAANKFALDWFAARAAFVKEKGVTDDSAETTAYEASWKKEHPLPRATLDDVVAHIDHVAQLVGVDHVGLGSDFDGVGDSLPEGLKDVSMYPNLFARLLARGYSEADIEKIAGGNLMRVWREAERVAKELSR